MKILLITTNTESIPDPVFPLGASYISGALKENLIDHKLLDLCFSQNYENDIKTAILDYSPDIVAMSLRNIDTTSYPNFISYIPFYKEIIQIIKNISNALIIVGGAGFSIMPKEIINNINADLGIVGEGENNFVSLIKKFENNSEYIKKINNNLIFKNDNEFQNDYETDAIPDRNGFDINKYYKNGGMLNIQTKRGCPFKCIYCTYPVIEGRNIRQRHPKSVCDEIDQLLKLDIKSLFIVDNEFLFPDEHVISICNEIIKRKQLINWSCYANPGLLTDELAHLMVEAGLKSIDFGSDAANDKMLYNLGKNFTVKDLFKASQICEKNSIKYCHSIILGGPGETMDTVKMTLDNILDISPTIVTCLVGIRIYPNTKLYKIAIEEKIIEPDNNLLEPCFYISKDIRDKILPYIDNFSKNNPDWFFPGFRNDSYKKIQKGLRKLGYKGPLWEHLGRFKKK